MNAEIISASAGILISVMLAYVPGLRDWWDKQTGNNKRLVLLGSLLIITAATFFLGCQGVIDGECSEAGLWDAASALLAAIVANQSTYSLLPTSRKQ